MKATDVPATIQELLQEIRANNTQLQDGQTNMSNPDRMHKENCLNETSERETNIVQYCQRDFPSRAKGIRKA